MNPEPEIARLKEERDAEQAWHLRFKRQNEELREDLTALRARCEELTAATEASRRVMGCGYCGREITHYTGPFPMPTAEAAKLIATFAEHDAACPHNPLTAERNELRDRCAKLETALREKIVPALKFTRDYNDDATAPWDDPGHAAQFALAAAAEALASRPTP